jgi:DNA-binding FadR family transcriptional regulator
VGLYAELVLWRGNLKGWPRNPKGSHVPFAPFGAADSTSRSSSALRELIDVQGLEPGDRLMSERDLAERLGVSRTSVRQALTALEVMGLVRIRHGGGVFLARPQDTVLPSLASELVDRCEQLPAVIEVHEAIETQTLAEPIDQTRRASLARPGRPPRSLDAHRAILDAIERQDEDGAATSMREHLAVVGDLGFLTGLRAS